MLYEVITVNPLLERASGYSAAELIGQTPRVFASGQHDETYYQAMWQEIEARDIWRGDIVNRRKDGRLIEEWLTIRITSYNVCYTKLLRALKRRSIR